MLWGRIGRGAWGPAVEACPEGQAILLFLSWTRIEPQRGAFAQAELDRAAAALSLARKRGIEPVICLHAKTMPDWQLARGGWLDPDVGAMWGCYVDRVLRDLGERVGVWLVFDGMIEEAAWYGPDQRVATRAMLDAHAAAWLLIHRGPGFGGRPPRVGGLEEEGEWLLSGGARRRLQGMQRRQWTADRLAGMMATGKLAWPVSPVGELPNGSPCLDLWGLRWRGRYLLPDGPHHAEDEVACGKALLRAWEHRRPLLLQGVSESELHRALQAGVRVDFFFPGAAVVDSSHPGAAESW
ncbi:MAG TPA: family 1 glycosylhydrolase [Myxococcota bacterium]|nr:family 1 glycosylhydrolase [Myxococcota bacterium]